MMICTFQLIVVCVNRKCQVHNRGGGWSTEVDETMRELFGARGGDILLRIQRAVISHTLNIARTLKVMS